MESWLNRENINTLGFSCGRKNGKSSWLALLIISALHEKGPLHKRNMEICIGSPSQHLSLILSKYVSQIVEASGIKGIETKKHPLPHRIEGHNKSTCFLLPGDKNPSGAHGFSANFAILDEAGLFEAKAEDYWASFESALGATGGYFAAIGTRLTGELFNSFLGEPIPNKVVFNYSAPITADIHDPKTWKLANPSLQKTKKDTKGFKSYDYLNSASEKAKLNPRSEQYFRSHELNQKVEDQLTTIITLSQYKKCVVNELPEKKGPVYIGFDPGENTSFTAATLFWPETGRMEFRTAWPQVPSLQEREKQYNAHTIFTKIHDNGEMVLLGGQLTDNTAFLDMLARELQGQRIGGFAVDTWKKYQTIENVEGTVFDSVEITWLKNTYGDSPVSQTNQIRTFREYVHEDKIKYLNSHSFMYSISKSKIGFGRSSLERLEKTMHDDLVVTSIAAVRIAHLLFKPDREVRMPVMTDNLANV